MTPRDGDFDPTRAAILRAIAMRGPISRTHIAEALSVSPATVTSATRDLIEIGLVAMDSKAPTHGRGRPLELLAIVPGSVALVGAKVMEDHVIGVVADLRGHVVEDFDAPFDPASADPAAGIARILANAVDLDSERILGIGLGVPGMVDTNAGGRVTSPMFGWHDLELGRQVADRTGLPVIVDNDVNTLTVAERLYGTGRAVDGDFITVTLGRGIGLGMSLNGALHRGHGGGAGELGHVRAVPDGRLCDCGRRGCLETVAGEPALVAAARDAGVIGADDGIVQLRDRAARSPKAASILHEAGIHLGRALADLVNILAPGLVIVSGEGLASWPWLEPGFRAAFEAGVLPIHTEIPFVVDEWHDRNWARGAASLVLRSVYSQGNEVEPEYEVRSRLNAVGVGGPA